MTPTPPRRWPRHSLGLTAAGLAGVGWAGPAGAAWRVVGMLIVPGNLALAAWDVLTGDDVTHAAPGRDAAP